MVSAAGWPLAEHEQAGTLGWPAGFTKRAESPYDPFGAGHSSTSISAALGMAVGRDVKGRKNNVVAVSHAGHSWRNLPGACCWPSMLWHGLARKAGHTCMLGLRLLARGGIASGLGGTPIVQQELVNLLATKSGVLSAQRRLLVMALSRVAWRMRP